MILNFKNSTLNIFFIYTFNTTFEKKKNNNNMKNLLLLFSVFLLLTNCSSSKRYDLNVKKGNKKQEVVFVNKVNIDSENSEIKLPKSLKKKIVKASLSEKKPKINYNSNPTNDCDLIIFRNGDELSAKVIEIGEDYVKYKTCDNLNGPVFNKSADGIFMIKYANGTKTIFKQKTTPSVSQESKKTTQSNNASQSYKHNKSAPDPVLGVISMLMGLVGIFFLPIVFSSFSIILGIAAMASKDSDKVTGTIGFILGVIGFVGMLVLLSL